MKPRGRERHRWASQRPNGREHMSQCGQRTSFNRTREAGNLDEIQGVVADTLNLFRNGASLLANAFGVGVIDWF